MYFTEGLDTLIVNGDIGANGNDEGSVSYTIDGGGGSGGSIYITTPILSGSGSITADGGAGDNRAGGGGGGRIAFYYDTSTYVGSVSAHGGTGTQVGGAGTIYVKSTSQTYGELLTDNNNRAGAATPIYEAIICDSLTIQSKANAVIETGATVTTPTTMVSNGNLNIESGAVLNTYTITLSEGTLNIESDAVFDPIDVTLESSTFILGSGNNLSPSNLSLDSSTITNNGNITLTRLVLTGTNIITNNGQLNAPTLRVTDGLTFYQRGSLNIADNNIIVDPNGTLALDVPLEVNNLTVKRGGILTHSFNLDTKVYAIDITAVNLVVESGGKIEVVSKGYSTGNGPGAGAVKHWYWAGSHFYYGGGGGYGGNGGTGRHGATGGSGYGSITEPTDLGSGGGLSGYGGAGGGSIQLIADTLTIDGFISANGNNGSNPYYTRHGGGGSGGSIYITTSVLNGSGSVNANGGNGGGGGGGGSGGRIAIYLKKNTFTGSLSVKGGSGDQNGEDGSMILFNLHEQARSESVLIENLVGQEAVAENFVASGDLSGFIDFTNFEIVTIATGSFAGKGFSKGEFEIVLEGAGYTGNWHGVVFYKPQERKICLKGSTSGDISATVEGVLRESVAGSGIYDEYQATWNIGSVEGDVISATLDISGALAYQSETEFSDTEVYVLQADMGGCLSGDYEGSLSAVINHIRISDANNPYDGKGLSMISYVSEAGSGEGWTYDTLISPNMVELEGLFDGPLFGVASGTLYEGRVPRALSLEVTRIDLGLPPSPDLKVKTWGPDNVSPGQTINYMIEYRNDGLLSSEETQLILNLPDQVSYTSTTGGGTYKYRPHEVIWHVGSVPAMSAGYLSAKVRVLWGLSLGTAFETIASIPKEKLEIVIDPEVVVDYETVEATEDFVEMNAYIYRGFESSTISVEQAFIEVSDEIEPVFDFIENEGLIELPGEFTVTFNPTMRGDFLVKAFQGVTDLLNTFFGLKDLNKEIQEWQSILDCLYEKGYINDHIYEAYSAQNKGRPLLFPVPVAAGRIKGPYGSYLAEGAKVALDFQPWLWRRNIDMLVRVESGKRLSQVMKECLEGISHATDSQETRVFAVARDPSVKYGPDGRVSVGERLDYRVEYENEGEGIAFGVYFTDTLDEALDDSTLEIGPVVDVNDGSIISGPGTYNPATRTITWFAGEVDPNQGGYSDFSINVRADANDGTEIINFATIYFPSVPEETRTNGIVSIVSLNEPPVADAGDEQVVFVGADCLAEVMLDGSGSSDVDGDELSYCWSWTIGGEVCDAEGESPAIQLPLGEHTIELIVNDGTEDSEADYVVITVEDDTPPEVSVSVEPEVLWPPNHKMVQIAGTVVVSDNCDEWPEVQLVGITMNEGDETNAFDGVYDDTQGDGHTVGDIQVVDGLIYLRAERSGNGDGRVYTITYRAVDDSGNAAEQSATVIVPHDQS